MLVVNAACGAPRMEGARLSHRLQPTSAPAADYSGESDILLFPSDGWCESKNPVSLFTCQQGRELRWDRWLFPILRDEHRQIALTICQAAGKQVLIFNKQLDRLVFVCFTEVNWKSSTWNISDDFPSADTFKRLRLQKTLFRVKAPNFSLTNAVYRQVLCVFTLSP